MPLYQVIGWYSRDATDPKISPYARLTVIEAQDAQDAYDYGERALLVLCRDEGAKYDFLNWFVKEIEEIRSFTAESNAREYLAHGDGTAFTIIEDLLAIIENQKEALACQRKLV